RLAWRPGPQGLPGGGPPAPGGLAGRRTGPAHVRQLGAGDRRPARPRPARSGGDLRLLPGRSPAPAQRTRRPGPGRGPVRSGAGPPRATRRRLARVGPGPARTRRAGRRRRCPAPLPGPAPGGGRRRLHPPLPGRTGGPPVSIVRRGARALFLLPPILLLAACATSTGPGGQLQEAARTVRINELELQSDLAWARIRGQSRLETWTIDGPALNRLLVVTRVKPGEHVFLQGKQRRSRPDGPWYRAGMRPDELRDL